MFAWRVAKYVKSNAIVCAKDKATLGIGAGQMSRVVSSKIAALKAQDAGLTLEAASVASDAFFPFRDGLDVMAELGIKVRHPAGRLEARRRGDRGRGRARHRHGVHRHAPLPPLDDASMKVLIVGGGGREHALAWKCAQSPRVERVFVAPGNAGTAARTEGQQRRDRRRTISRPCFEFAVARGHRAHHRRARRARWSPASSTASPRPDRALLRSVARAARLEGSKAFTKEFLKRHGIPTAGYCHIHGGQLRSGTTCVRSGCRWSSRPTDWPPGKGVVICETHEAAIDRGPSHARRQFRRRRQHHRDRGVLAGRGSELHRGRERSAVLPLATSQDHKRRDDGDQGPNTGGMGAYSPAPIVTPELHARIMREVIEPTLRGLRATAIPTWDFSMRD